MDEDKAMILLTVWSNVIATITLIYTIITGRKKKTAPKRRKHKRKR